MRIWARYIGLGGGYALAALLPIGYLAFQLTWIPQELLFLGVLAMFVVAPILAASFLLRACRAPSTTESIIATTLCIANAFLFMNAVYSAYVGCLH